MYDEDKIINEKEITEKNNTIEIINDKLERDKLEALQRENQTLKQMVENRNQEIKKEPESDKIQALSKVLGIEKMKAQIDELNQGQNAVIGKLSEVITGMNNLTNVVNGRSTITEAPQVGDPMQKLELLGTILDKIGPLYQTFKQSQTPQAAAPLIDQEFINHRMVESFMEDLDTGKSISTFIKNSLKKTASKNIVNTALKDIGSDNDEPA